MEKAQPTVHVCDLLQVFVISWKVFLVPRGVTYGAGCVSFFSLEVAGAALLRLGVGGEGGGGGYSS